MVVLTFKTLDDREREVEFDGREEAIARMDGIPITCSNTLMCMTKAGIWLRSADGAKRLTAGNQEVSCSMHPCGSVCP
jgi:hypothetical protein